MPDYEEPITWPDDEKEKGEVPQTICYIGQHEPTSPGVCLKRSLQSVSETDEGEVRRPQMFISACPEAGQNDKGSGHAGVCEPGQNLGEPAGLTFG